MTAFDPVPFLDLMPDYGAPWTFQERNPAGPPAPAGTADGARPAPVTARRGGQR